MKSAFQSIILHSLTTFSYSALNYCSTLPIRTKKKIKNKFINHLIKLKFSIFFILVFYQSFFTRLNGLKEWQKYFKFLIKKIFKMILYSTGLLLVRIFV